MPITDGNFAREKSHSLQNLRLEGFNLLRRRVRNQSKTTGAWLIISAFPELKFNQGDANRISAVKCPIFLILLKDEIPHAGRTTTATIDKPTSQPAKDTHVVLLRSCTGWPA